MKFRNKVAGTVASMRAKAVAVGTSAMVLAGSAMASGGGEGFDSSTIISKINENAATAVLIVGAVILAGWGIRSMGLLRGRG